MGVFGRAGLTVSTWTRARLLSLLVSGWAPPLVFLATCLLSLTFSDPMNRKVLVLFGAVIVGNWLAERFLLKASEDDPTGFVVVSEGFGMDDVVRAAAIVGIASVADRFTR